MTSPIALVVANSGSCGETLILDKEQTQTGVNYNLI